MHTITSTIDVPNEHPCFAGHFPGNPIVPGALLMQWIVQSLYQQLPACELKTISSIKFTAALKPGDRCELCFQYTDNSEKIRLTCRSATGLVCKAVLLLQQAPEAR